MQKPIFIFLALFSYSWYTNLTASFVPQAIQNALSSSVVTLQEASTNNTLSDDASSTNSATFIATISISVCAIACLVSVLVKKYCCPTGKCPKECRPRCGKCRHQKNKERIFPSKKNTIVVVPKLDLSKIDHLAEKLHINNKLATVVEGPSSQTCQTSNTHPISFRTSLTQPQSQKTSPDQDKIDATRCEATILNGPSLDPLDKLTRAAITARYQIESKESPV